jgi:hypothetical protein
VGEGHAFVTTLSCFHPRHFLCVFFVDCHKGLSSSSNPPYSQSYSISGVVVSVLALSAVDRGFEPSRVQPKTIKLVFVASPLSMQH